MNPCTEQAVYLQFIVYTMKPSRSFRSRHSSGLDLKLLLNPLFADIPKPFAMFYT